MKRKFLNQYTAADASGRFDLLMRHIGTIDVAIDVVRCLIKRDIKAELMKQRREQSIPLGTKVQESGKQDPTGDAAVINVELEEAVKTGTVRRYVQENIDHPEAIIKEIDDLVQLQIDFDLLMELIDVLAGGDWLRRHLTEHHQLKELYDKYDMTYESMKDRKAIVLKTLKSEFVSSLGETKEENG